MREKQSKAESIIALYKRLYMYFAHCHAAQAQLDTAIQLYRGAYTIQLTALYPIYACYTSPL